MSEKLKAWTRIVAKQLFASESRELSQTVSDFQSSEEEVESAVLWTGDDHANEVCMYWLRPFQSDSCREQHVKCTVYLNLAHGLCGETENNENRKAVLTEEWSYLFVSVITPAF
jgi:hypothetical protein